VRSETIKIYIMNIRESGAKYSAIVGISEKLKAMSKETGREFLFLNRGINAVCNIDLSKVIREIDFNADKVQVYPPAKGMPELRDAINHVYFGNKADMDDITIIGGSTCGLDISFQSLDLEKIWLPSFFWGTYAQIMAIRNIEYDFYENLSELTSDTQKFKNCGVVICDPGNPVGNKYDDDKLIEAVRILNDNGTIVFFDSPYRRVFFNESDTLYQDLLNMQNVIIIDSFSKSVGLSGQRIGFIHTKNKDLNKEMLIRVLFATNGINAFAQVLVYNLLTTEAGKKALKQFRETTVNDIGKNIRYLSDKGLLAEKFYTDTKPLGIFVIVNRSEQELLNYNIGSVSLSYFTRQRKEEAENYARICASVPHEKFRKFMEKL